MPCLCDVAFHAGQQPRMSWRTDTEAHGCYQKCGWGKWKPRVAVSSWLWKTTKKRIWAQRLTQKVVWKCTNHVLILKYSKTCWLRQNNIWFRYGFWHGLKIVIFEFCYFWQTLVSNIYLKNDIFGTCFRKEPKAKWPHGTSGNIMCLSKS